MSYIVCHMEKYKRQDVSPVERENERDESYAASNPNIDSERTSRNYHIIAPPSSYMDFINSRIAMLTLKRKLRSDAVHMNSYVLTSNKEFFAELPPALEREFFADCVKFFADKYGRENIISAIVHKDETTPHLHLNLVPITNGKLCSKDLYDRKKLSELQTEFYEIVGKKWGLERGKFGSQAKHLSSAEFRAKEIISTAEEQAKKIKAEDAPYHEALEKARQGKIALTPTGRKAQIIAVTAENETLHKDKKDLAVRLDTAMSETIQQGKRADKAERDNEVGRKAIALLQKLSITNPEAYNELMNPTSKPKHKNSGNFKF